MIIFNDKNEEKLSNTSLNATTLLVFHKLNSGNLNKYIYSPNIWLLYDISKELASNMLIYDGISLLENILFIFLIFEILNELNSTYFYFFYLKFLNKFFNIYIIL